jgi:hypothetical protein
LASGFVLLYDDGTPAAGEYFTKVLPADAGSRQFTTQFNKEISV